MVDMDFEILKQLVEISLTVAVLVLFLVYGIKRFNAVLESHKEERENANIMWLDKFEKMENFHKEERASKDAIIRDLDLYTRNLTKETYGLMNEFSKQLSKVSEKSEAEKQELKRLIIDAKSKAEGQLLIMLEVIGDKLGVEDRKFYKTDI